MSRENLRCGALPGVCLPRRYTAGFVRSSVYIVILPIRTFVYTVVCWPVFRRGAHARKALSWLPPLSRGTGGLRRALRHAWVELA